MSPTFGRIATILFLSGFCSLVYQVAWLRHLRLVFGVSTASTAVVLAIFMGGLGLGGAWLGRRVERLANPLAFYSFLELGIALAAAASPLLIGLARSLYFHLGGVSSLGMTAATLLRLALSVLILGIPTTLMGGTLPAVAKAVERDSDRGRRLVAGLYAINTGGAVVGAFLTTFLLLELLGVRQTLWISSALNLLLFVVVRSMSRQSAYVAAAGSPAAGSPAAGEPEPRDAEPAPAETAPSPAPETAGSGSPAAGSPAAGSRAAARLILAAAFIVGFVFFLMELVWYRMLGPVLGGSSFTFGLILAVALAGIAIGGALYSFGPAGRRPTLQALAWTCVLEGLCLAFPYALGDDVPLLAAVLRQLDTLGFSGLVFSWTMIVCLVVLPAAIVSGYQFPLLVALLGSGRDEVGKQVGMAYAWNTFGAIAGSLAGGFGLIPLFGAPRLWWMSALFLVFLGLMIAASSSALSRRLRGLAGPVATAAVTLACCLAAGPTAFWRHTPVGAGRLKVDFHDVNKLRNKRHAVRRSMVREADGIESSVALMQTNELSFFVNGKSDGSALSDAPTQVWCSLVGGLLHPAPQEALIVGLGTGTSAGWMAHVESIRRVDVIELEPAIGRFAEEFAPVTFDSLNNPKVNLTYGDGRELVLTTPERYDVITSVPSNPYRAGMSDFFSQDFYRGLSRRLKPGGIFLQWVQGYEIDADVMRLVYSTISSVFPQVETWQIHDTDLLLVATLEPLRHDFDRIRRQAAEEPFASALRWLWKVEGAEGFFSGFVAGPALAKHLAQAESRISTDDQPLVEFGFARNVGRTGLFNPAQLHELARRLGADRPSSFLGAPLDWGEVEEARQIRILDRTLIKPTAIRVLAERLPRHNARAAYAEGDFNAIRRHWFDESNPQPPRHPMDYLMAAETLVNLRDERAPAALEELGRQFPTEAAFLAARRSYLADDLEAATSHLARALGHFHRSPWIFRPAAVQGLALVEQVAAKGSREHAERLLTALAEPLPVLILESARQETRVRLLGEVDFPRHCVEVLEPFEPHTMWEEAFLRLRLECYSQTGHPLQEEAREDLETFLEAAPPTELDPSLLGPPAQVNPEAR